MVGPMWTDCIYHANCPDGFGGAYAVWKALGPSVKFHPGHSGVPVDPARWAGRRVLLVDFCWAPADLLAVSRTAERIRVIDHHASSADALKGFSAPNVELTFDMEASGASLAWRVFHPGKPLPELLAYVEDYDLWRHALPYSGDLNLALTSHSFDFETWDRLSVDHLLVEGRVIARWVNMQVDRLANSAERRTVFGHEVPCLNAPRVFVDRVGARLAAGEPFAVVWAVAHGKVHASLRSHPEGLRVDRLASDNGGRGHPHAAVVSLPLSEERGRSLLLGLAGGTTQGRRP